MSRFILFLAIVVLASLNLGCKKQEEEKVKPSPSPVQTTPTSGESAAKKGNVLALVDGVPIYREDLRAQNLEMAIMNQILYQEALRQGWDKKYERQLEQFKKRLVMGGIISELLNSIPDLEEVTEDEIERFYNQNINKYRNLRVQELSTDDQKSAEQIKERIEKGEDLEKIGSELPTPVRNYMINANRFQETYGSSIDEVEIGTIMDAQEDGKYKILKIVDVKNIPMSKARQSIYPAIIAQKKQAAIKEYVEKIKQENNVKVEVPEESKSN